MRYAIWVIGTGYLTRDGTVPSWTTEAEALAALHAMQYTRATARVMGYQMTPAWAVLKALPSV